MGQGQTSVAKEAYKFCMDECRQQRGYATPYPTYYYESCHERCMKAVQSQDTTVSLYPKKTKNVMVKEQNNQ
jgi:hypothetical protein